jgi:2-isopropylmalate synthase
MTQKWNAKQYIDNASFVAEHGLPVLGLLNPQPKEKILDLGCGDGALTKEIENIGADVLGIDSSSSMIDTARERGLTAYVMSGDQLIFQNEFDAVFSNAALHWMKNSDAVIQGVFNSLKKGGRFVGEFGGEGNIEILVYGIKSAFEKHSEFGSLNIPWYFPSAEEYKEKLEENGFRVDYIKLIPRPTPLKTGVREWLKIFSNGMIRDFDESEKEQFLTEVEQIVRPKLLINDCWMADYVRLRFSAQKL